MLNVNVFVQSVSINANECQINLLFQDDSCAGSTIICIADSSSYDPVLIYQTKRVLRELKKMLTCFQQGITSSSELDEAFDQMAVAAGSVDDPLSDANSSCLEEGQHWSVYSGLVYRIYLRYKSNPIFCGIKRD